MASAWTRFKPAEYPKLDKNIEARAVVIGGGIAGTTATYLLAKAGTKTALIEKADLSKSVTAYTTAFLTQVIDTGLAELKRMFGDEKAKAVWQSHAEAIDAIERIVQEEKIDCEFMRCNNYMYANDEKEWRELKEEAKLAREYGFEVEEKRDGALGIKNAGYVIVKNQAKFHPLKYLDAVRKKAAENGALIFENTEALEISNEAEGVRIATKNGTIEAKTCLIATHDLFNKPPELFAHKGTYSSYIMEFSIPRDTVPEGIYEDQANPYHYFRLDKALGETSDNSDHSDSDRLILGGEDHRHEVPLDPEKAYAALEEYFKTILPGVSYKTVETWGGPIIETIDGLAFIGTYSDKHPSIFAATGFSGNGMTYGTLSGLMFSDFAEGREIRWKDLYDPKRSYTATELWQKGKDYVEEFVHGYGATVFRSSKRKKDIKNTKDTEGK